MITDLKEIQKYIKDKHICLLGNARSILDVEKDIDKFDIVCRMNRGVPQGKEKFIGSRTDIVFMSTTWQKAWEKQFNTKFIVWMTENDTLATEWIKENAIQNPKEDWYELRKMLPSRPSTGCMSIFFLLNRTQFKKLTIYGFTFFDGTGTWYHNLKKQSWHKGGEEKKLIMNLIKDRKNIELVME